MIDQSAPPEPYIGPRSFGRQERSVFFGRDREIREVFSLIIAHRTLLLYAPSGAGKTSLINAGVVPQLEEEGYEVLPVDRLGVQVSRDLNAEEIENIFVFNALSRWAEDESQVRRLAGTSLAEFWQSRPHRLDQDGLTTLRILIFDQFEELFTFAMERWRDREKFFQQVNEALENDPLLRVVFSMREDFLAQLDPFRDLLPDRLRTRYRLERLRQEGALAAVKGPLQASGRSFEEGVAEQLVQDLLRIRAQSLEGASAEVAGEFIEPVQLQVVCRSLWQSLPSEVEQINLNYLTEFVDVDQALVDFYHSSIQSASRQPRLSEGKLRAWFERSLITPAGTRATIYRGRRTTGDIPNQAIDVLEAQHIIRGEWRAGARWYELTHDRFIGPILESNRAWREARRARFLRYGILAAVAILLVMSSLLLSLSLRPQSQVIEAEVVAAATRLAAAEAQSTMVAQQLATAQSESTQAARVAQATITANAAAAAARASQAQSADATATATATAIARATAVATESSDLQLLASLVGTGAGILSAEWSPDGRLASGSEDGIVIVWDLENGQPAQTLKEHTDPVLSVAWSGDGRLASGSHDGTVIVWDMESGQPAQTLEGHTGAVTSVAWSGDGRLASGSDDGTVIVWDLASGQPAQTLKGHKSWVFSVAWSDDGRLASGGDDGTVIVWDLESGQPAQILRGHSDWVNSVAWSGDGLLASGSEDRTVIVWDLASGRPAQTLEGHTDLILSVAWSPDGRLATGSGDGTVIVWDLVSGQPAQTLQAHSDWVYSVAWSGDGLLASGYWDGTLRVWQAR